MSQTPEEPPAREEESGGAAGDTDRTVVVTPDGSGVAQQAPVPGEPAPPSPAAGPGRDPTGQIEEPAKVMRVASMVKQLLEEVRSAPLDDGGRRRMAEIHRRSLSELERGLAPELVEELERLTLPFEAEAPSDAELRIAQAQLVGWLEGLFHGIQAAVIAQQAAAQHQLQQIRQALPAPDGGPGPRDSGTGQYL